MSSVKFVVLINYQATIEPRPDETTTELGANRAATTGAGTWWEMRLEKYQKSLFLLQLTTTFRPIIKFRPELEVWFLAFVCSLLEIWQVLQLPVFSKENHQYSQVWKQHDGLGVQNIAKLIESPTASSPWPSLVSWSEPSGTSPIHPEKS